MLHAGGKFGGGGYKVSGGLHGVGVSVVNALSEWLRVEIRRDGERLAPGVRARQADGPGQEDRPAGRPARARTTPFRADPEIFETTDYSFDTIAAALPRDGLPDQGRLDHADRRARATARRSFYFEGGIAVVRAPPEPEQGGPPQPPDLRRAHARARPLVEVALQYNDTLHRDVLAFANNINTVDGGTHLTGFRAALTRTLNDYARKAGILKDNDANLTGDDVREGLTAVISVKLTDPQFEGQTKAKLGNAEVKGQVQTAVTEGLGAVPRGEPGRRPPDHREVPDGRPRPRGRPQGARAGASARARSRG